MGKLMTTLLKVFSIFISTVSYGQLNQLRGTWITPSQNCLLINDTFNKYGNSNMLCNARKDEGMSLFIYGDTLSFQKKYYPSYDNRKKDYFERYDLKIILLTDTNLIVMPVSSHSKKFFKNKRVLKFIRQEYAIDTTIKFEKIIYHTTHCYGTCPIINLQIDNSKNIYLDCEFYTDVYNNKGRTTYVIDSTRSGKFIGILNDTIYQELILLLKTCNLKKLKFKGPLAIDAPVTRMIIYYNGRRKYLKSKGFTPTISDRLINYMYHINSKAVLTRTTEEKVLEK